MNLEHIEHKHWKRFIVYKKKINYSTLSVIDAISTPIQLGRSHTFPPLWVYKLTCSYLHSDFFKHTKNGISERMSHINSNKRENSKILIENGRQEKNKK